MTTDRDLDRVLDRWLAGGSEVAPAADVAAALRRVEQTPQRSLRAGWRTRVGLQLRPAGPFWVAAAVVVGVIVGTGTLLEGATNRVVSASITARDFPWAAPLPVVDDVAFVAVVPAEAPQGSYWRSATYDQFELDRWTQSDVDARSIASGQPLLGNSAEAHADDASAVVTVTVRPHAFRGSSLLSPGIPLRVDADARVRLIGSQGWLAGVEVGDLESYTVEARVVPAAGTEVSGGVVPPGASPRYPAEVVARYTAVPPGALGPEARHLLATILADVPGRDPYAVALATQAYLRDPAHFTYSTDPAATSCDRGSIVECFARNRTGYCLQYATTMAILLRAARPDDPIPTRLVQGFLPGRRSNGTETVETHLAHAWVEVYIAGSGWIPFDPTLGVGRPIRIGDAAQPPPQAAGPNPEPSAARP